MENNGKGIFYGVIGVATLIVAIIGATFAFFTAANSDADTVTGTAASAGLDLTVTEQTTGTGVMVPQLASTINNATTGTDGNSCIDANGNTVCKVYKIEIENTGSSAVVLAGTITFSATEEKFMNLQWAKSQAPTNGFGAIQNAIKTTVGTDLYHDEGSQVSLAAADGTAGSGDDYDVFYVVVFINEINTAQETVDTGTFTGTVSFNSAAGGGVTSTFTAA